MMKEAISSLKSAVFCLDTIRESNQAPTKEQLGLIALKVRNALAVIELKDKRGRACPVSRSPKNLRRVG